MRTSTRLYAEENFPPHWYVRRMIGEVKLISWVPQEGSPTALVYSLNSTALAYSLNKIIDNAQNYLRTVNSREAVNMSKPRIAEMLQGNGIETLATVARDMAKICSISPDHPKLDVLADMSMTDKAKLREYVLIMKSCAEKLVKDLGLSQPAHSPGR
jgi:hypothetical protein